MIGLKFITKHDSMVEAISEPYQRIVKDFPQGVEDLEYETCVVVKYLESNDVSEIGVGYLKSIPTDQQYEKWNNGGVI